MGQLYNEKGEGGFLKYIAYLQVIGIVLVVLGHSFHEYPDGNGGMSSLLYRILHSFRMPVFMFVSGFLMVYTTFNRTETPSWRVFAIGKVKRLMVPFVVLSIVTFVPRSALSLYADEPMPMTINSLIESLLFRDSLVIPYFWFLQSSFTLLLGSYFILYYFGKNGKYDNFLYASLILVFFVFSIVKPQTSGIFSLGHTLRYGLYFVLGACYCKYGRKIDSYIPWNDYCFFSGVVTVWVMLFYLLEETPFMPICSIFGIAMCVSLSKILVHKNVTFLDHLIGANYIIFLLSWYFNVLCQQVLHRFIEMPWPVYTMMSLMSGIYVPWLFYRYMRNHPDSYVTKLSKLLLGQSYKRPKTVTGH